MLSQIISIFGMPYTYRIISIISFESSFSHFILKYEFELCSFYTRFGDQQAITVNFVSEF